MQCFDFEKGKSLGTREVTTRRFCCYRGPLYSTKVLTWAFFSFRFCNSSTRLVTLPSTKWFFRETFWASTISISSYKKICNIDKWNTNIPLLQIGKLGLQFFFSCRSTRHLRVRDLLKYQTKWHLMYACACSTTFKMWKQKEKVNEVMDDKNGGLVNSKSNLEIDKMKGKRLFQCKPFSSPWKVVPNFTTEQSHILSMRGNTPSL